MTFNSTQVAALKNQHPQAGCGSDLKQDQSGRVMHGANNQDHVLLGLVPSQPTQCIHKQSFSDMPFNSTQVASLISQHPQAGGGSDLKQDQSRWVMDGSNDQDHVLLGLFLS